MLGICGRTTIAAAKHLATAGNAGQQGANRIGNRFAQQRRGLVFEVGAVNEVLLNSLFEHGVDDTCAALTGRQLGIAQSPTLQKLNQDQRVQMPPRSS